MLRPKVVEEVVVGLGAVEVEEEGEGSEGT
jgi:hypothetical protein